MNQNHRKLDANRSQLTGAPRAHPVNTRIGSVVGGWAGTGASEKASRSH